jgi:hypothetical protein
MKFPKLLSSLLLFVVLPACSHVQTIPGTTVQDNRLNRHLIEILEDYRTALESKDPARLLALAHPQYFEDSGTAKTDDDYGYDGLRQVLQTRLAAVRTLHYNIEYRRIQVTGTRALVDVRYDATLQMATAIGDRWERKQNDKRIELEREGERWLIISGM